MTWGVPLSVSYHFAFSYCSWGSQGKNTEVVCHSLLQWTTFCQTSPPWVDGQHWNQTDYILCSQRWRSSIQSTKTRQGADCGSDHELLIAKFRLKLKKVGKPLDHSGMTSNSIKLSHAVWGHPRWTGHGGEVWQNVVHCRRKWQTASAFLPWEPHDLENMGH